MISVLAWHPPVAGQWNGRPTPRPLRRRCTMCVIFSSVQEGVVVIFFFLIAAESTPRCFRIFLACREGVPCALSFDPSMAAPSCFVFRSRRVLPVRTLPFFFGFGAVFLNFSRLQYRRCTMRVISSSVQGVVVLFYLSQCSNPPCKLHFLACDWI